MNKRKRIKEKECLAAALPGLIHDKGWGQQIDLYSLFVKWDQIVDKTTAEHTRPLKIVRGVFWVEVDNSAWIHQLQFEKLQILDKLNSALELSRIKDIKFTLAVKTKDSDNSRRKKSFFLLWILWS